MVKRSWCVQNVLFHRWKLPVAFSVQITEVWSPPMEFLGVREGH